MSIKIANILLSLSTLCLVSGCTDFTNSFNQVSYECGLPKEKNWDTSSFFIVQGFEGQSLKNVQIEAIDQNGQSLEVSLKGCVKVTPQTTEAYIKSNEKGSILESYIDLHSVSLPSTITLNQPASFSPTVQCSKEVIKTNGSKVRTPINLEELESKLYFISANIVSEKRSIFRLFSKEPSKIEDFFEIEDSVPEGLYDLELLAVQKFTKKASPLGKCKVEINRKIPTIPAVFEPYIQPNSELEIDSSTELEVELGESKDNFYFIFLPEDKDCTNPSTKSQKIIFPSKGRMKLCFKISDIFGNSSEVYSIKVKTKQNEVEKLILLGMKNARSSIFLGNYPEAFQQVIRSVELWNDIALSEDKERLEPQLSYYLTDFLSHNRLNKEVQRRSNFETVSNSKYVFDYADGKIKIYDNDLNIAYSTSTDTEPYLVSGLKGGLFIAVFDDSSVIAYNPQTKTTKTILSSSDRIITSISPKNLDEIVLGLYDGFEIIKNDLKTIKVFTENTPKFIEYFDEKKILVGVNEDVFVYDLNGSILNSGNSLSVSSLPMNLVKLGKETFILTQTELLEVAPSLKITSILKFESLQLGYEKSESERFISFFSEEGTIEVFDSKIFNKIFTTTVGFNDFNYSISDKKLVVSTPDGAVTESLFLEGVSQKWQAHLDRNVANKVFIQEANTILSVSNLEIRRWSESSTNQKTLNIDFKNGRRVTGSNYSNGISYLAFSDGSVATVTELGEISNSVLALNEPGDLNSWYFPQIKTQIHQPKFSFETRFIDRSGKKKDQILDYTQDSKNFVYSETQEKIFWLKDNSLFSYDLNSAKASNSIEIPGIEYLDIFAPSNSGKVLLASSMDSSLKYIDLNNQAGVVTLKNDSPIYSALALKNGKFIAVSEFGEVKLFSNDLEQLKSASIGMSPFDLIEDLHGSIFMQSSGKGFSILSPDLDRVTHLNLESKFVKVVNTSNGMLLLTRDGEYSLLIYTSLSKLKSLTCKIYKDSKFKKSNVCDQ